MGFEAGVNFSTFGPPESAAKTKNIASIHVHSAVHVQRASGDVRRALRSEKEHGFGDVVNVTESTQRNLSEQAVALLFGKRFRHVGVDETGCDAVHRDVAAAELARER